MLISDDLGSTVRRFTLNALSASGRGFSLHLLRGRVFILAAQADDSARVFEVDATTGGTTPRGDNQFMSALTGFTASTGVLTTASVSAGSVKLSAFDPSTNVIHSKVFPCSSAACQYPAGTPFLSSDGELFDLVTFQAGVPQGCLLTLHATAGQVDTDCSLGLVDNGSPFSSFGGKPYDFTFFVPDHAVQPNAPATITATSRHWIPSGAPRTFDASNVFALGAGFFTYSASAFIEHGDEVLFRVLPDGTLRSAPLAYEGCLSLSPFTDTGSCSKLVTILPLSGDEVLFIARRDESQTEAQSSWVFELRRSNAPFTAFQP